MHTTQTTQRQSAASFRRQHGIQAKSEPTTVEKLRQIIRKMTDAERLALWREMSKV
jgi:hypothetical protein